MTADDRGPTAGPPRVRARPDPRPSRLTMAAGALAAVSVMAAGLVRIELPPVESKARVAARPAKVKVERRVRYIRLRPGQKAPPGARVIREAAPEPRVIIRHVAAPSTGVSSARRPIARTRQSG